MQITRTIMASVYIMFYTVSVDGIAMFMSSDTYHNVYVIATFIGKPVPPSLSFI